MRPRIQCAEGHAMARRPQEDDVLLACGCYFDPHDLNTIAVAHYQGVDIPTAVDHWRARRGEMT